MSKPNRPTFAAALLAAAAALLAALLPALAPPARAQKARGAAAAVNPKTAAVREAAAEVLRETSELRELPVLRPVKSGAQSRAEIERMIIRNLDTSSTPAEMRASEVLLKRLGLAPADFALRPFIIKLLTEQVAGYYDSKRQEFFLADWIELEGQKPVMAHELTHALQDQHFDLRRFEDWPEGDSDAELAAHALIEGDATFAMTQYISRSVTRQLALLKSLVTGGSNPTEQIDKAPRALRETLLFPYDQGSTWTAQLYRRGGWALVSKAYTELPASTEQIMHPEKYFRREAPLRVGMTDLSAPLGKGWRRTDSDVNGEWTFYLILDEYLKDRDASRRAAAGWGGDRYALYEGPRAGDALVVMLSAWDTERDAREFFDAYEKRARLRYGLEQAQVEYSYLPAASTATLRTKEGEVLVERRGAHVAVLEGVPAGSDARQLLKTLWDNSSVKQTSAVTK